MPTMLRQRAILLLIFFIAACSASSPPATQAPTPPPTEVIVNTATLVPAILPSPTTPPTETPKPTESPTPTSQPTKTPAPTPTPQLPLTSIEGFNFSFAAQQEVLPVGGSGKWDSGNIFQPDVFFHEGQFHMLYVGFDNTRQRFGKIGYATSPNGLSWTKYAGNPILSPPNPDGLLLSPSAVWDGNQWVLYAGVATTGNIVGDENIRATAPELSGAWTIDSTPILPKRGLSAWDRKSQPASIFYDGTQFDMYYMGIGGGGIQMGLATSQDGLDWMRHDLPETTAGRLDGSDPILGVGDGDSWDLAAAGSLEVMNNDGLWEMFYVGAASDPFAVTFNSVLQKKPVHIGYASSQDGINWEKHPRNPVITLMENCFTLLSAIKVEERYYIYYDRECGNDGIGALVGEIDR